MKGGRPGEGVFLNYPFDRSYEPILYAIVFTVCSAGLTPRSALETDDATENRLEKLFRIIRECRYGIHDISRTELDPVYTLPRFNMPLELGIFLGAKRFGGRQQKRKACLILARELYDHQKFLSDLAGQDVHAHHNDPRTVVTEVRSWLRTVTKRSGIPGGEQIWRRYELFRQELPEICRRMGLREEEVIYTELVTAVVEWLQRRP